MTGALDQSLIDACGKGDVAQAEKLLAQGADVNVTDKQSALVQAAANGHLDCVRWLLDHGADVNLQHGANANALHCAAWYGHFEIARLLVERGADLTPLYDNKTPLQIAREQKRETVARYLERNPDQISFIWPLDNRTVQEIYHFPRRERITLLRKCEGGDVETMQRESFAAVDRKSLREAFAEHKRQGGKLSEEDVFPEELAKPRTQLRL
jgi:hypothetical protein